MIKLSAEQIRELKAVAASNNCLGRPCFIHKTNRAEYQPLIDAGLIEWGPAPGRFDPAAFGGVTITQQGRDAIKEAGPNG